MSAADGASVREQLAAGACRGLGCAADLARAAGRDPDTLRALVEALSDKRRVVVARAANALKTVQRADARALDGFVTPLLRSAEACSVLEARWNLLLLLGRVRLTQQQKAQAVDLLFCALTACSSLERVHALDALAHISFADAALRLRLREVVARALEDKRAAVRARARRLLQSLIAVESERHQK